MRWRTATHEPSAPCATREGLGSRERGPGRCIDGGVGTVRLSRAAAIVSRRWRVASVRPHGRADIAPKHARNASFFVGMP
eukprot:855031-Prymnesium_polylepis.1